MGSFEHGEVGVTVEEVVLLHQDGVVMLFLCEVSYCFKVLLLKVLLLQLLQNNIFLFELTESHQEDLQVLLNILGSLSLYLSSYSINITEMMLSNSLNESLVLFNVPIKESGLGQVSEPLLVILTHNLEVVLGMLDLLSKRLELFKIVEELELIQFWDLDCTVLLWLMLLLLLILFDLSLAIVILHHRIIKGVV